MQSHNNLYYRSQIIANCKFLYGKDVEVLILSHKPQGVQAVAVQVDIVNRKWRTLLSTSLATDSDESALSSLLHQSAEHLAECLSKSSHGIPLHSGQPWRRPYPHFHSAALNSSSPGTSDEPPATYEYTLVDAYPPTGEITLGDNTARPALLAKPADAQEAQSPASEPYVSEKYFPVSERSLALNVEDNPHEPPAKVPPEVPHLEEHKLKEDAPPTALRRPFGDREGIIQHSETERSKPQKYEEVEILSEHVEVSEVLPEVERTRVWKQQGVRMLSEPIEVSEPVEGSESPQLAGEYMISQLFGEFNAHLETELSDGARRRRLEECGRRICSITNQSVVREAVQAVASTFASHICDHFAEEMAQNVAAAQKAPWRAQLPSRPLQSADEHAEFLSEFVHQHLHDFYNPYDETIRDIARQAARNVSREVNVPHELMPGLAKLALYDFIMFCDNSDSMQKEDRVPALRDTLGRTATFATILSPDGISVRILNYAQDVGGWWDNLKTVEDVNNRMDRITYNGSTPLGTILRSKILEPMILQKARDGSLKRPVIVVIITDGEANDEPPQLLRDGILDCNSQMERLGYSNASVVFLISRVGTSEEARQFVEGLGDDHHIGRTVYVSASDLALKRTAFERAGDDNAYTLLLIQLFLSALEVRTRASLVFRRS